ncbi:MAG: hypothetical protein ACXABO_01540 [Promethearchaeota archaeon]|jgi:hypothetical protein
MDFKEYMNAFTNYNKRILKKLVIYGVLVLYFTFLIFFNHFRITLDYSVEGSWGYGIGFALISTIVLIFVVDILWFSYKKRK